MVGSRGLIIGRRADESFFSIRTIMLTDASRAADKVTIGMMAPWNGITQFSFAYGYGISLGSTGNYGLWGCGAHPAICTSPPTSSLVDLAKVFAGGNLTAAALKTDGTLIYWGVPNTTLTTAQKSNVKEVILFDETTKGGITILYNDGTVGTTRAGSTVGCTTNCPLVKLSGLTGISSVVSGGTSTHQLFQKSDGTIWCLCSGTVVQATNPALVGVTKIVTDGVNYAVLRSDGSVRFQPLTDITNPSSTLVGPVCTPSGVINIGMTMAGPFIFSTGEGTCALATQTPAATATRTATAKLGKPSATKVVTKTPTKSPTKSRTPTKPGKPTKTPTKKK
jgi:hypothetical protein